jgi:hypothetical protein
MAVVTIMIKQMTVVEKVEKVQKVEKLVKLVVKEILLQLVNF